MNPFRDPLELYPQRSWLLALATLCVHVLAGLLIAVASSRVPALLVLLLPVAGSAAWYWLRQRRGGAAEVTRLTCRADGTWRWQCANGSSGVGEVAASSVYTTKFVLLHLRGDSGRRRSLLLLPDSLDPDAFRRLRARVRLTAALPEPKGGRLL